MLRATLRSFFAHKGRLLLSALAVVLSVAFVVGSLIFSDTTGATFDRLFASTASDVRIAPRQDFDAPGGIGSAETPTVPAALRNRVAGVEGVADAHLDVSLNRTTVTDARNEPVGPTRNASSIVGAWYPSEHSPVRVTSGRPPRGAGEAMLDRDSADRKGIRIGDTLHVIAPPGTFSVRVVGIATLTTTNPGASLVFLETRAAQRGLLGSTAKATGISVDAAPGVPDRVLKSRISAALGPGASAYDIRTRDEQKKSQAEELGDFLGILKYMMVGFAGVAVLVGVFLIVNTFSMLIAQRTRELGLLRALGADRRQVRHSVLLEALLLGVFGATVGLAAGVGLAVLLVVALGWFGLRLNTADLVLNWPTVVVAYAVGVGVTFVAALLPALRASRVSPMAALSGVEVPGAGRPLRARAIAGSLVGAAGVAALVGCALSGRTAVAGTLLALGVLLTLPAVVIVGPLLVRPVIRLLGRGLEPAFGTVGRMSRRNALRNPRRTGATAAALMVGLALVAGLSVAGASAAVSVGRQIDRTLGADFVVQNASFAPFSGEITERVRATPGVGTVVRQRIVPLRLNLPDGRSVTTVAGAFDRGFDAVGKVTYAAGGTAAALAPGRVGVQEKFAREHGLRVGSRLNAVLPSGRPARFTVGALTADSGSGPATQGGIFMGMATLEKYVPRGQDSVVYVNAADGVDPRQLRADLERTLTPFPQVQVNDRADYKKLVSSQIQGLLNLLYGLLGLAIVIAVLGVVNTLALSVVERTREIGLLRAVGLSRKQLRRMIRLESVVIALFGALLGLGLGLVWGAATHRVLALEGLTAFAVPWSTVAAVVIGSVLVGLLAALLPALRASRLNILAAIAHE
ncbi:MULTISPECIES: ABC transporter permease [Streptomyces]|uniref:ABC transporter permease n=1 Tax=Streptomyces TaxID=1883 RepID=UPI0004CD2D4E|nr:MULTISPECIES: FtsX-like permease family protein [Streptomyces]